MEKKKKKKIRKFYIFTTTDRSDPNQTSLQAIELDRPVIITVEKTGPTDQSATPCIYTCLSTKTVCVCPFEAVHVLWTPRQPWKLRRRSWWWVSFCSSCSYLSLVWELGLVKSMAELFVMFVLIPQLVLRIMFLKVTHTLSSYLSIYLSKGPFFLLLYVTLCNFSPGFWFWDCDFWWVGNDDLGYAKNWFFC